MANDVSDVSLDGKQLPPLVDTRNTTGVTCVSTPVKRVFIRSSSFLLEGLKVVFVWDHLDDEDESAVALVN